MALEASPGDAAAARLKQALRARAQALGFLDLRVADARAPWDAGGRLHDFIELGRHGEMAWMEADADRRAHPNALWPEAQSALVLAASYAPSVDPLGLLASPGVGAVAAYATRRDYHDAMKGRLKQLAQWFAGAADAPVKVFVDTAPLMEKPLAQRAGLGWQGKHTNLVSRAGGSWLLLGVILTSAALAPDAAETDHCGACRACLDICPTNAFPAPYQLDARRCLAYLTIEHKGPIPRAFRAAMGNRIFGCDDCLAVCPWNKFAAASAAMIAERAELQAQPLESLAALDDAAFRARFAGSPIKRTGRDRFVRNVLTAIGNAADPGLAPAAHARLDDESPLVRAAAVWALSRLLDAEAFAALRSARMPAETDSGVIEEWTA